MPAVRIPFFFPALFVALLVITASAAERPAETSFERECAKLIRAGGTDAGRLQKLFQLRWDYQMAESPETATYLGYPGQNGRWTDLSPAAVARRKREWQAPLRVLASIRRGRLSPGDQLSFDLFKKELDEAMEGLRFKGDFLVLNQMAGVQIDVAQTMEAAPHGTVRDYEEMLARLRGLPVLVEQTMGWLEQGLAVGITPPSVTFREVPEQVRNQMEPDPAGNPVLLWFKEFPAGVPAGEQERLRKEAVVVLAEKVIPAWARLHEFLVKKYLPGARATIALGALPDGPAWYAYQIRVNTTTGLSAKEIHALGLSEVKRIHAEMDRVMAAVKFKGTFDEFLVFLRTDPQFYFTDAESLLRAYRDIAKRADPELAKLFGRLPRLPYGVLPVPAYSEKSQTTAYYMGGSLQTGRPGYFFANTYDLKTRPKWEMEPLTLHEAMPGHHLQIALAQEMEGMPEFRKNKDYTAFVEGWGLYAESLGAEMGFYRDPYAKFGQLTYEMWRAIRLVVDTGIHSMGWTRQQAIDFFLTNASKNEHDITVEVDRYIVWPGQALAYKIGELKIKELRAHATRELGDKFDIRTFHDELLSNGALPLDVLETRLKAWVARQKTRR